MQIKKLFSAFIIFSLVLPTPLLSQAAQSTNILDVVQAHKPGEFFRFNDQAFILTNAGITGLDGIERIEHIGLVKAINLANNNLEVIKANTFNHPVFKKVKVLNLSANRLNIIDSDALQGLESLEVLSIENNNLNYLADGALNGLDKLKYIYIANNPGIGTLKSQIKEQLPQVTVYTLAASKRRILRIAAAVGIGVAILAGVLLLVHQKKKVPVWVYYDYAFWHRPIEELASEIPVEILLNNDIVSHVMRGAHNSRIPYSLYPLKLMCIAAAKQGISEQDLISIYAFAQKQSKEIYQGSLDINQRAHWASPIAWPTRNPARNPLEWAIYTKNLTAIRVLIEIGAQIKPEIFYQAVAQGDVSVLKLLMEKGANPQSLYLEKTIFKWAQILYPNKKNILDILTPQVPE